VFVGYIYIIIGSRISRRSYV